MTIGDFWGLNRKSLSTQQTGNISVVLINTDKGSELFSSIEKDIIYEERLVEEAVQGNPQLRSACKIHSKRKKFLSYYVKNSDFESAVMHCGVKKEMRKLKVKNTRLWRGLSKMKRYFGD